jgi:hypothetical protein
LGIPILIFAYLSIKFINKKKMFMHIVVLFGLIIFLEINLIDKYANIKIGRPKIEGIYDVKELLPLIKLIITPQKTKNIP